MNAMDIMPTPPSVAGAIVPATPTHMDQHPAAVYLSRLDAGSRRTMREALDLIAGVLTDDEREAATLDWAQLRYQHTAAIRALLAERYAPATVNKQLAALRGVLKEAWRLGQMDAVDYHRAVDLPGVRGETLPAGRALTPGEIAGLLGICTDGSVAGARDAALIATLYGAGLRRSEAVALDRADYEPGEGGLAVRSGKGRKARMTYLPPGGVAAMEDWLGLRGEIAGPLFVRIRRGGHVSAERLSAQSILDILRVRATSAGVAAFSPHDLRRTFMSDLLDAGVDIATVQRLAGHANVQTTSRYDRRGEAVKRKAAAALHIPYRRQFGER